MHITIKRIFKIYNMSFKENRLYLNIWYAIICTLALDYEYMYVNWNNPF